MTIDEAQLKALLAAGEPVTLSIDTNISRSSRIMRELLELARQLAERAIDVRLVVSAPAFAEILMDVRRHWRGRNTRYDPDEITRFITENTRLEIAPFDVDDARHMAARLDRRFGDDEAWQAAKIDAAFAELKLTDRADTLRRPSARCSATVDWLIGSQAERRRWLLATDDKGPEFSDVEVVRHGALRRALDALTTERPSKTRD